MNTLFGYGSMEKRLTRKDVKEICRGGSGRPSVGRETSVWLLIPITPGMLPSTSSFMC